MSFVIPALPQKGKPGAPLFKHAHSSTNAVEKTNSLDSSFRWKDDDQIKADILITFDSLCTDANGLTQLRRDCPGSKVQNTRNALDI